MRFHPTLLALAAHYRYEPRSGAPARAKEKGRVEPAIRFVRDRFFAARSFRDLDDLNVRADAWCEHVAAARRCPEDRARTVRAVFEAARSRLLALPDTPFQTEERLEAQVGKAPYARFDGNDCTVPHTHVRRTLSVLATPVTVRIVEGSEVLAVHGRSFDRGRQIEDPEHIAALVAHKCNARASLRRR